MLSRATLRAIVRAYVDESKRLCRGHAGSVGSFAQEEIANRVFPARQTAKHMLSRVIGPSGDAVATPALVRRLLQECRALLANQHRALQLTNPQESAREFERRVCQRLHVSWNGTPDTDSLWLEARVQEARCLADLGLPDISTWREGAFGFAVELKSTLDRSYDVLHEVVSAISDTDTPLRRLELSQMAISIASLNHPGTPHHEIACELATQAVSRADLLSLRSSPRTAPEQRRTAIEQLYQLHNARLNPTLDSPFNFAHKVLNGLQLSPVLWSKAEYDVDATIAESEDLVRDHPRDSWACRLRSSALSLKARFLVSTGGSSALRMADECHEKSLRDLDRLGYPYGFAYPVLRAVGLSQFTLAISVCEQAIETFSASNLMSSASAFAALCVHLHHKQTKGSLPEDRVVELARTAVADPSTLYQCSHIFDATAVKSLVKPRDAKRSVRYRVLRS